MTDSPAIKPDKFFQQVCSILEGRIGRGWKRKFAEALSVPETTIQGWLKAERFPKFVESEFLSAYYHSRIIAIRRSARICELLDIVIQMPDGTFAIARKSEEPQDPASLVATGLRSRSDADNFARMWAATKLLEIERYSREEETDAEAEKEHDPFELISIGDNYELLINARTDFLTGVSETLPRSVAELAESESLIWRVLGKLIPESFHPFWSNVVHVEKPVEPAPEGEAP